ncbi:MAG: DUF86 domain-containing protein [Anaerolineales bacterium]
MELAAKKLVYDVDQAVNLITEFTADKEFEDYATDVMLRSAVERQFEIVGEALNRLKQVDMQLLSRISDYHRIIGFRNVLAHGYDVVSDEIVWDIIQNRLPLLRQEIDEIKWEAGIAD